MITKELYTSLEKALIKFKEALDFPDTEPMRESTIQRFEYTFELAWKLMSSILKDQSLSTYGVKNIIRESAKLGIIQDVQRWFDFALARNLASHIYKEEIAIQVHETAKSDFAKYIENLLERTKNYLE